MGTVKGAEMTNLRSLAAVPLAVGILLSPAHGAATAAPAGDCSAARKQLATTKQAAGQVYRAEVDAARREFRRSDRAAADRRELRARIGDARQARAALVGPARNAVRRAC